MTAASPTFRSARTAERLHRTPVRIWPLTWWGLYFNARFDAHNDIPFVAPNAQPQSVATKTAVVTRIETRADEYATVEGLRFKFAVDAQWTHWEAATKKVVQLRAQADALAASGENDDTTQELARRIQRRIDAEKNVLPPLESIINARFSVGQLRSSRFYDNGDQLVALYWRTLRRHSGIGLSDVPPALDRQAWLSSNDGITVLEQWNSTANAPKEGN